MRNTKTLATAARRAAVCFVVTCAALCAAASAARAQDAAATPAQTPGGASAVVRASEAAKAAKEPKGSISGRVVGEGGEPMSNAAVFVRPRGQGNVFRPASPILTDAEGNFVAPDLEPGVYAAGASVPGYTYDTNNSSPLPGAGYRPGDVVTIRMTKGGVITGAVTDAAGEPLVALIVRVFRVRDHEGNPPRDGFNFSSQDETDDRGVYRVYGLPPGAYVVVASTGNPYRGWFVSPQQNEAPTFYPSGTRDTATEVNVRPGQEVAGVDIRYRDERGHRVTGTLVLPAQLGEDAGINVTLTYAGTGMTAGNAFLQGRDADRSFSLEGVADGEYELQAQQMTREGTSVASPSLRVSVRGADVTGLKLTLAPLASVSGRLLVEALPEPARAAEACKERNVAPRGALVVVRRDVSPGAKDQQRSRLSPLRDAAPDEAGAFSIRGLEAGPYRFEALLDDNFYLRSVELPGAAAPAAAPRPEAPRAAAPPRPSAPPPADTINISAGQQLSGLNVRVAAGAAYLSGRIVAADPNVPVVFNSLRVYLVPAERERADERLRYAETAPDAEGVFTFRNLAPGHYLLVARPDTPEERARPAFLDPEGRTRLRREADSAATPIELQPCQRTTDFSLRYPQTTK